MQRPLKFRVWNTKGKNFYTEDHVKANLFNFLDRTQEPVMMFTGLLDKNGKEIYEGDVVEKPYDGRKAVEFREGCFFPFNGGDCGDCSMEASWINEKNKTYEVIGNLYENPELIEKV